MAALPNLRRGIGNRVTTSLSASVTDAALTMTVSDATGMSADGGYIMIDEEYSNKREIVYVESVTSNTLTISTSGRGLAGTTAVSHDSGATVTDIVVDENVNGIIDTFLVSHEDNGTHKADSVDTAAIQDGAVTPAKISKPGLKGNVIYYTSNDTWTKPDELKYIIVKARGGGGGGGGCASGTNAVAAAAGGGQGGYAESKIDAASLDATEDVVIGNGGSGGIGNNTGGTGNSTIFGSNVVVATGGSGGNGVPATGTAASGGEGGSGTGDFVIRGSNGMDNTAYGNPMPGHGGGEGAGRKSLAQGDGQAGVMGGGGSGALKGTTGQYTGGAGGDGWMIIEEYF